MLAKDRDDQSLVLDCKVEARVWTFIIDVKTMNFLKSKGPGTFAKYESCNIEL